MKNSNRLLPRGIVLLLLLLFAVSALPVGLAALSEEKRGNNPPIAENLEFTTFRDIAITERLCAVDPEGDFLIFSLAKQAKKGLVTLAEDGSFCYTPNEGKKGKDTFTYIATDSLGNVSKEAKVCVVIEKPDTKVTYSDMAGHEAYYAALKLAEANVFIGEQIGDSYVFKPQENVSRGEFLMMCLKAAGAETINGITRTGFADDAEIPLWLKPYISTGLLSGYITGFTEAGGKLVFSPDQDITFSEASVLLNNVLAIGNVGTLGDLEGDVPAWAYQAALNLSVTGILKKGTAISSDAALSRGQAAMLLCRALELTENGNSSLLSWAK